MAEKNRGACVVCGDDLTITAKGGVRTHGPKDDRCTGSGQPPAGTETTGQSVVNGMREDAAEEPTDRRPTAAEFKRAQVIAGAPGKSPEYVEEECADIIARATQYGVRPDHDGPNPHRAPLPRSPLEAKAREAAEAAQTVQPGGFDTAPQDVEATGPADTIGTTTAAAPSGFDAPAPVAAPKAHPDTEAHRLREGPQKDDFDQWGRYKLPDPLTGERKGRQRVTTFAKMISDQFGLSKWQQRMLLKGAVDNPAVAAQARGLDVKVNAATMDVVADALKELAGDKVAANKGTEIHSFTEELDLGRITHEEQIPEWARGSVAAYANKMAEAGLVALPEFVERTTMVRSVDVAGTLDRILQLPNGEYVIGDVKTGQDLTYGWLDIGVQLACYAHGVNENGVWEWDHSIPERGRWLPAPKVRTDFAIVMHMPAGSEVCTLYRVDLDTGWANAVLAADVRERRKNRRHSVLLATDGPEFQRTEQAVASFGNAGTPAAPEPPAPLQVQPHTAAYAPQVPAPAAPPAAPAALTPPVAPFVVQMSGIWTQADAATVYGRAQGAGVAPADLAELVAAGSQRLDFLEGARRAFRSVRSTADAANMYTTAVATFGADAPILAELVQIGTAALNEPPF